MVPIGLLTIMKTRAFGVQKLSRNENFGGFFDAELPDIRPDEVLIRVHAAGLNFNSLWSLAREPVDPFSLISGMVTNNPDQAHHLLPYQILGSDASGVVVEVGSAVTKWKKDDQIIVHCGVVDVRDPLSEVDDLQSKSHAIWGYETNFGAFATYAIVRELQIHAKPSYLSWEEAASYMLTLTTAYRMLLSPNGADLKRGETCLIWGAAGGLGLFAIQLARHIGAVPIAVVSSTERAEVCKKFGADVIINRHEMKHELIDNNGKPNPLAWREWKKKILGSGVELPNVVFEHVGRETLSASVYLAQKGGRIVTCAASSGFEASLDLRYLWMNVKSVIGSHISNRDEAQSANKLVMDGTIKTTVSDIAPFEQLPDLLEKLKSGCVLGKAVVSMPRESAGMESF